MTFCGPSIISLPLRCKEGGFGRVVWRGWCGVGVLYEYSDNSDTWRRAKQSSVTFSVKGETWASFTALQVEYRSRTFLLGGGKKYNSPELYGSVKVELRIVSLSKHLIMDPIVQQRISWRHRSRRCVLEPSYRFKA